MSEQSNRKTTWLIILIIALAIAVRVWIAWHYDFNFDNDEACLGLIANDLVHGKFYAYTLYNQRYMGSLESILSAVFIKWLGQTIIAMRIAPLLLFGLFFILHARLVQRLWGGWTACYSLMILALPNWVLLWFGYRSHGNHAILLVLVVSALYLCLPLINGGWFGPMRLAALGVVLGLGMWTLPTMLYYILVLLIVFILQSPEWSRAHQKLSQISQRKWGKAAGSILFPAFSAVFVLVLGTVILRGIEPLAYADWAGKVRLILLAIIMILGVGSVIGFYLLSKRRQSLIAGSCVLLAGFIIGNQPQWGAWLFQGLQPDLAMWKTTFPATLLRLKLMALEVFPLAMGVPSLTNTFDRSDFLWSRPPVEMVFWVAALLITLAMVSFFLWNHRRVLQRFMTLAPVPPQDRKILLLLLIFILPIMPILLNGKTGDAFAVRYLLYSWHAYSIMMAITLVELAKRWKPAAVIAASCLVLVGILNFRDYVNGQGWQKGNFSEATVTQLQAYLDENHIKGGYSDSGFAYAFTYVFHGKMTFVPCNLERALPASTDFLSKLPTQAYIFFNPLTQLPQQLKLPELANALRQGIHGLTPAFPWIMADLDSRVLLDRRLIGNWDVWLVQKPSPANSGNPQ